VLDLDIDKQIEVFFRQAFSRLGHNLLNCLDVPHDASNHKGCQLFDSDLSSFEVSDEHAFVKQHCVFALQSFVYVVSCFEVGACCGRGELVLSRVASHNFLLLFLTLWRFKEAVAAKDLSSRL